MPRAICFLRRVAAHVPRPSAAAWQHGRVEAEPTIGVITALPKEYAAVHAMLDSPVDVSRGSHSPRKYVTGNIKSSDGGTHQVALVLLPTMGQSSAAQRTTSLLDHFPG